jgi:hypothetical protein
VTPAVTAESASYEDDGATLNYRQGNFMRRVFRQIRTDKLLRLEISRPEGDFRPAARELVLEVLSDREPASVVLDGRPLPRRAAGDSGATSPGWTFTNGVLWLRTPDQFQETRFGISY